MRSTLEALDSVTLDSSSKVLWTFGGGASLAIDLGHRISYDIDAFLDSAKIIQRLVPVRNDVTQKICWNPQTERADFQYPGHYLKLIVKDKGEIDFLSATPLLDQATLPFEFEGREIERERPAEIIAKKIYYRGSTFKSRDIFDLACLFSMAPEELAVAARSPFLTPDVLARVRIRITARASHTQQEILQDVNPTDKGQAIIGEAVPLALSALETMQA